MSKNVCVCSFPIFDNFDIHSITALRCIWSILDIFDIDSITFKENESDISDIFDMPHTLYKNVCVCSFPIFDIFDIHSITALKCTWCIFNMLWYTQYLMVWLKNSKCELLNTFCGLKISWILRKLWAKTCLHVFWAFDQLFIVFYIFDTFNIHSL